MWLILLLARLFGVAPPAKGGLHAVVRTGGMALVDRLLEDLEAYVAAGGGNELSPDDAAYLGEALTALEMCAAAYAPRRAKALRALRRQPVTVSSAVARLQAVTALLLGAPGKRLVSRAVAARRRLTRRAAPLRPLARPAAALELSG